MSNFADYVIDVCDRNYTVTGTAPLYATTWNDLAVPHRLGFKWSILHTAIPLPFVSYTGKRVMWYAGWQKFRQLRAQVQSAEQQGPSRLACGYLTNIKRVGSLPVWSIVSNLDRFPRLRLH